MDDWRVVSSTIGGIEIPEANTQMLYRLDRGSGTPIAAQVSGYSPECDVPRFSFSGVRR